MTLKFAILCALLIGGVFGQNTTTTTPASTTTEPQTTTKPTTTAPPSSTTVAPPSPPQPAPESRPSDVPEITYAVPHGNSSCVLAKFSGIIAFQYNDTKKETTRYLEIVNATVDPKESSCNVTSAHEEEQMLVIMSPTDQNLKLTFIISKDNQSEIFVSGLKLEVFVNETLFPHHPEANGNRTYEAKSPGKLWAVPESNYYSCHDDQDTLLVGKLSNVTLILNDLKLEAFRAENAGKDFAKTVKDCKNASNDIVPIAVGCALAALVVIVLIAYFVGRRRSRRSAYQSV